MNKLDFEIQGSYTFKEVTLLVNKDKLNNLDLFFQKVSKIYPKIYENLFPFNIEVSLKRINDEKFFLLVFKQTIIVTR